jgi:hypothetical protein
VAGANDYCTAITTGDAWVGYYRSTDGGRTWRSSLVPGYPTDKTSGGVASPTHGSCSAGSDPTQAFDRAGRLFYGFICFNRAGSGAQAEGEADPTGGLAGSSTYVATYDQDGAHYVGTALVAQGSRDANEDKINLAVDDSGGRFDGNVYTAWVQVAPPTPEGFPQDPMLFARSTDHGASFSKAIPVSDFAHARFPDVAVGPDGVVYVAFRIGDSLWVTRSTNGGRSFRTPVLIAEVFPFDSTQFSGGSGQDCGSGRFSCNTGMHFARFDSEAVVAADADGVHVVWNERSPQGQSKMWIRSSTDRGATWSEPVQLDGAKTGHQFFPDIASAGGELTVAFYDSRYDPGYSPWRAPGNTADKTSSGPAVDVFVARSTDGGQHWTEQRVTSEGSNFGLEVPGKLPFWGDYLYVSSAGGAAQVVWTDSRDVVTESGGDFSVYEPCFGRAFINDPCLSKGGDDQNIYTARI